MPRQKSAKTIQLEEERAERKRLRQERRQRKLQEKAERDRRRQERKEFKARLDRFIERERQKAAQAPLDLSLRATVKYRPKELCQACKRLCPAREMIGKVCEQCFYGSTPERIKRLLAGSLTTGESGEGQKSIAPLSCPPRSAGRIEDLDAKTAWKLDGLGYFGERDK